MSEMTYSLLLLISFLIGFILGILFSDNLMKKAGKINSANKNICQTCKSYSELNEEYKNFLNYDGFDRQ